MRILSAAFVAGAGIAALALGTAARPAPGPATGVPSFTAAQASSGQSVYYANCVLCHGVNLEGTYGPALKGSDGNVQWQSVSDVYAYMSTKMPAGNAGGLSSTDYVNLMALLLQAHGHRAGFAPLTASVASTAKGFLGP